MDCPSVVQNEIKANHHEYTIHGRFGFLFLQDSGIFSSLLYIEMEIHLFFQRMVRATPSKLQIRPL